MNLTYSFKISSFFLLLTLTAVPGLIAQEENVVVDSQDIVIEEKKLPDEVSDQVDAPVDEYGDDWWMIDVTFSTEKEITEEITVKVYMEAYDFFKEEAGENAFVILTSEVTFINVLKANEHRATFYLHPGSAERYSGSKSASDLGGANDYNVRVEISESRQPSVGVNMFDDEPNWFQQGQQIPDVLISVEDSPWWPFEAIAYNQIKKRR